MNHKSLAFLAMVLLTAPAAVAREGESGGGHGADDGTVQTGGADDGTGHDANDDNGGGADDGAGHDANDDNGDDGAGHDAGDDNGDDNGDDAGDDHGGSGRSGNSGSWQRARQDLLRDTASPDADVTGYVEVRTRTDRERFSVEVEHLDPSASIEVFVEDASGTPMSAGTVVADAEGEAELELDTGDGATLPAGAATVADLAGRRVEVRDASGNVLLAGLVPSLDGTASSSSARAREKFKDADTGVRTKVTFKVEGRKGRQRIRMEAKPVDRNASVELWLDDGTGTLVKAADMEVDHGGRARLKIDSRKGDALPLGVLDLSDLSGRAFEVRADGVTVASGNLPVL